MNKAVENGQIHALDQEVSALREANFILASTAAIPIIGGPSEKDRSVRNVLSQKVSALEQQNCPLKVEQNNHV